VKMLSALFKGKDSPKEEMKEAKAVKAGKVSPKQYARGEKMEGDKKSTKTLVKKAQDIKSGKLSPSKYAKGQK
jgi:hypothetical protein